MSEPVFQNSGCVNTILGSLNQLNAFLPLPYNTDLRTTLNKKYGVLDSLGPVTTPQLLYFGIGTNGYSCSVSADNNPQHIKHQPDCRNMDLYAPIPIRMVPIDNDLSFEERRLYRMRTTRKIGSITYACYYLKKIEWLDLDRGVEIVRQNADGTEDNYAFDKSYLNPTPTSGANTGGSLVSDDRLIVRAVGKCEVSMQELREVMSTLYDQTDCTISEFGFYTGCDVYIDTEGTCLGPVDDDHADFSENNIEACYVQLAKHKTQKPVTLDSEDSSFETTVSFEASNSISV